MDWLRNNYDKAILAAACLLLLVCCALIIVRARTFPERFAGRDSSQPIDNTIKALPADAIKIALNKGQIAAKLDGSRRLAVGLASLRSDGWCTD